MNLFENEDGTERKLTRPEKEYLEMVLGKMIKDLKMFGSIKEFSKNFNGHIYYITEEIPPNTIKFN